MLLLALACDPSSPATASTASLTGYELVVECEPDEGPVLVEVDPDPWALQVWECRTEDNCDEVRVDGLQAGAFYVQCELGSYRVTWLR